MIRFLEVKDGSIRFLVVLDTSIYSISAEKTISAQVMQLLIGGGKLNMRNL